MPYTTGLITRIRSNRHEKTFHQPHAPPNHPAEVGKASLVAAGLMILMTLGLAAAGQFHVDTSGKYGII